MSDHVLIRDLAFADGSSAQLRLGMAVRVRSGTIDWIGPTENADPHGVEEVIDGGGGFGGAWLRDRRRHRAGDGGQKRDAGVDALSTGQHGDIHADHAYRTLRQRGWAQTHGG